jgi:hypothetical protein
VAQNVESIDPLQIFDDKKAGAFRPGFFAVA